MRGSVAIVAYIGSGELAKRGRHERMAQKGLRGIFAAGGGGWRFHAWSGL